MNFGVPQGSVQGSLLFLLHFQEIPAVAVSANTALFADDTMLSCTDGQGSKHVVNCSLTLIASQLGRPILVLFLMQASLWSCVLIGSAPSSDALHLCNNPIPQHKSTTHLDVVLAHNLR